MSFDSAPHWVLCVIAATFAVLFLRMQARHTTAIRRYRHRELFARLMDMAGHDPRYMACWGPDYAPRAIGMEADQHTYINEVFTMWHIGFLEGQVSKTALVGSLKSIFKSKIARDYWEVAGPRRAAAADNPRSREFIALAGAASREAKAALQP